MHGLGWHQVGWPMRRVGWSVHQVPGPPAGDAVFRVRGRLADGGQNTLPRERQQPAPSAASPRATSLTSPALTVRSRRDRPMNAAAPQGKNAAHPGQKVGNPLCTGGSRY